MPADRAGRVRLIAPDRVRASAWPTDRTSDAQVSHQWQEHRRVTGLAGREQRDQRQAVAVDELVDLRRQPAAGAADRVIRRLDGRIRVIRSSPL